MNRFASLMFGLFAAAGCDAKPATSSSLPAATAVASISPIPSSSSSSSSASNTPATTERSELGRAVDEVLALRTYRNLAVSRGGTHVAYSVTSEPLISSSRRALFLVDRASPSAPARPITAAPGKTVDDRSPEFSPDGQNIAFVSDAESNGQRQLYLVGLHPESVARKVGHFDGPIGAPRFSPGGERIAILHTERLVSAAPSPDSPAPFATTVTPQTVAIVDIATGKRQFVSPPNLHVHEFDWAPDGKSLALIASPAAALPNYFIAKLYVLPIPTGEPRLIAAPSHQLGDPRFSPDGQWVSFISGLISDEGNTGGDLFVVPADGGEMKNLTPARKSTITAARWRADSRALFVTEIADSNFALSAIALDPGPTELLFQAQATLRQFNLSADGQSVVFSHDSFDSAPSVWTGPPRVPKPIEATTQAFRAPWGQIKTLHAQSDTYTIQSFLLAPKIVESGRKYPLITLVHGGPASSWVPTPVELGALAVKGYFLLLPNPRGSFGQGAAFQAANVQDLGHGDLRDIRASIREALAAAPIDPDRLGIMGWSYGGFMAMWAPTQSGEFRAAVAGAGISNWLSYSGQTDATGWMKPYFGASVYDDRAVYAKSEPIAFIKQARTPTLLLVGENDTDCPAPQSREYWQALETMGIPAQLVVYPHEAHGFVRPGHRRDRVERAAAWFDRHLAPR